jgi:hypothetical protein
MFIRHLIALSLLIFGSAGLQAQTMSFEQAGMVILNSCGADINKYCRNANLGSGGVRNCLVSNPSVSRDCISEISRVIAGVQKRAQARQTVLKICDADIRRLCGSVQAGDGQILECMLTAQRGTGARCNQAITDAGYR